MRQRKFCFTRSWLLKRLSYRAASERQKILLLMTVYGVCRSFDPRFGQCSTTPWPHTIFLVRSHALITW